MRAAEDVVAARDPVAFEMRVELGGVRDFVAATGGDPRGVTTGSAVPPTFLTSAQLWTGPEHEVLRGLDLNWSSVLHGGQRYTFPGPLPRVGDVLEGRQRLVGTREVESRRGRLRVIEFAVDFTRRGELVAREEHTTLQRMSGFRPPGADLIDAPSPVREGGTGLLPEVERPPVSLTDVVRYQGASGDLNPIHHDEAAARAAGLDGVLSVGMLHAGTLGTHVATVVGAEAVRAFAVRFRRPVWPGDRLVHGGRRLPREPGDPVDRFELWVRRDGVDVITGTAAAVPDRAASGRRRGEA